VKGAEIAHPALIPGFWTIKSFLNPGVDALTMDAY